MHLSRPRQRGGKCVDQRGSPAESGRIGSLVLSRLGSAKPSGNRQRLPDRSGRAVRRQSGEDHHSLRTAHACPGVGHVRAADSNRLRAAAARLGGRVPLTGGTSDSGVFASREPYRPPEATRHTTQRDSSASSPGGATITTRATPCLPGRVGRPPFRPGATGGPVLWLPPGALRRRLRPSPRSCCSCYTTPGSSRPTRRDRR